MEWAEFTEACRQLSDVRRAEAQRHAGTEEWATTRRTEVERLRRRLTAQRDRLTVLGRALSITPSFTGVTRSGATDIDEALRLGFAAADAADVAAGQAEERAYKPMLLPGLHPTVRNIGVYAASAFVFWAFGCGLWTVNTADTYGAWPIGLTLWTVLGIPSIAFFAGWFVVHIGGRPKIREEKTKASKGRQVYPESHALGGVICYIGMNLLNCFAFALSLSSTG